MCVYRTEIRPNCPLSDSNSIVQEYLTDIPLFKFNCYDACYNKNMATYICFGTLQPSIWKRFEVCITCDISVKWLDNFYNINFKRLFQYWNFCNKTDKFTFINLFNHTLLITNIFGTRKFWGFCYVSLNIPLMRGYGTVSNFSARCQWHFRYGQWKSCISNITCYFVPEVFNLIEKNESVLLLLLFWTLHTPTFPGHIFQIAVISDDKKKIIFTNLLLKFRFRFFHGYRQLCSLWPLQKKYFP